MYRKELVADNSRTKKYFDRVSKSYQERSSSFPWKVVRKLEEDHLLLILPEVDLSSVLEIGAGAGHYTNILLDQGAKEIVAVDISEKMLEQITSSKVTKIHSSLEQLDNTNRFSTIVSMGALEFCQNKSRALKKIGALLRPDGHFVLLTQSSSPLSLPYRLFHASHGIRIESYSDADFVEFFDIEKKQFIPPFSTIRLLAPKKTNTA